MKRIIFALCAAALSAASAGAMPAPGTFMNGNQLYSLCQQGDTVSAAYISDYVMGVTDTASYLDFLQNRQSFCFPRGVIAGQLKDIVCRGLQENPQDRQDAATQLVLYYIIQAYPCAPAQ